MSRRTHSWWTLMLLTVLFVVAGCTSGEGDSEDASTPPLPEGELALEEPWARPAPSGGTSAVYFRVANGTASADTLTEVRTPAADSVALHETVQQGDTTSMRPAGSIAVPAQQRVALEPGSSHIMLINLSQPLSVGDNVIIDVEFAGEGLQRINVPVRESAPSMQSQ